MSFFFVQILAQIRHGRLGPAEIVVASAQLRTKTGMPGLSMLNWRKIFAASS